MPGDDLHKIKKATTLGVDCICMDLEDGVAISRKDEARRTIAYALQTIDFSHSEKIVRVNPVYFPYAQSDLQEILPYKPDSVIVPKVNDADQVQWVSEQIGDIERENNWSDGEIGLIVLIETAKAIVNLKQYR